MDCTAITPEGCNKVKGGKSNPTSGGDGGGITGCIWAGDGPGVAAVYTNANIKKIRSSACNWPLSGDLDTCINNDSINCQIDGDQPPCPGCWGSGGILPSGFDPDVDGVALALMGIPPEGEKGKAMNRTSCPYDCCCEGLYDYPNSEACDTSKCTYRDVSYPYDLSGRLILIPATNSEFPTQPPYPCGPGLVCDLNGQCTKDATNAIGPCAPNPCKNNEVCFAKGTKCHDAESCKAATRAGALTHICVGPSTNQCIGEAFYPKDNAGSRNERGVVMETDKRFQSDPPTWCRVPCHSDTCGICPTDATAEYLGPRVASRTDCIPPPPIVMKDGIATCGDDGAGTSCSPQIQPYYWSNLTQPGAYTLSLPATCVATKHAGDFETGGQPWESWKCTNSNGTNVSLGSNLDPSGVVLPDYIPFILNGGSTNGGSTKGGSTNGGSTNGGSTNGGSTKGGSTNGGSTNGGGSGNGSGGTNACTSNPCQNSGVCKLTSTGYMCQCTSQFTGTICETPVQNGKRPSLTPATFNPATDTPVSVVDCQQKIARIIGNSSNYVLTRDPPYTCPNQKITVSVS